MMRFAAIIAKLRPRRKAPPAPPASPWILRSIKIHPDFDAVLTDLQGKLGLKDQCEVLQKAVQVLAVILDRGDTFWLEEAGGVMRPIVLNEAGRASQCGWKQ